MKNLNDIEKLIELFEKSSLTVMEVELPELKVKFDKRNFDKPANDAMNFQIPQAYNQTQNKEEIKSNDASDDSNCKFITSPLVGTFHQGPTANANPLVKVGDVIHKGQKLCMIEAMKVMNEITATEDGKILEVLVKDGSMVEYGQKLFKIGD